MIDYARCKEPVEQAGGIVIWGNQVVLRRTDKRNLVFPKGYVEAGETSVQAAVREVEEETGLVAEPVETAGTILYTEEDDNTVRRVTFYLMNVRHETPEWPRHRGTDAFPVPLEWAESLLKHEHSRLLLSSVRSRIEQLAGV